MVRGRRHKFLLIFLFAVSFVLFCLYQYKTCDGRPKVVREFVGESAAKYNRLMPLIFIGGVPRSGTTLMRAVLDAHPDVRCGQETRVVPRILQLRHHWTKSIKENVRLNEAGISSEVLNSAVASFIIEIIAGHGEYAPRLCNKDPLTLKHGDYLIELFPNAKFLFMVRDGRATVHSIITRKVTITGFDLSSYGQCLKKWNEAISTMYGKCVKLGKDRCMIVYYEQLVLHPRTWIQQVLNFVNVSWNDVVLHHDELINKPGGIILSKVERSSDQVIKPINSEALSKWVGEIPQEVLDDIDNIAPMLKSLGYDTGPDGPNYGTADELVQNNTHIISNNRRVWQERAKELMLSDVAHLITANTRSPSAADDDDKAQAAVDNN